MRLSRHRRDIVWAAGCAVATAVGLFLVQELWKADLSVPLGGADNDLNLLYVKGMFENGWYETNAHLGAPFGLSLYDFPAFEGDHLHLLLIKAMGLFTSSAAVAVNAYYLLSFPLSAVAAFGVLRYYKISRPAAAVAGVLFALLPDHFLRGEGHIFLVATWSVPLGAYLAIEAFAGRPLFARREHPRNRLLTFATRRTAATVLICVVVGMTDSYYAAFVIALVAIGSLVAALAGRRARPLLNGGAVVGLVVVTLGVNLLPNIIYRAEHGTDPQPGHRLAVESDRFALKLADLVLPLPDHRLAPLANLRHRYESTRVPSPLGGIGTLGTVSTIGLIGLLLGLAAAAALPSRAPPALLRYAGLAAAVALIIGTIGGLGTIFAYTVSPQLRAWQRIVPYIGFFALLAVAYGLDRLRPKLSGAVGRVVWPALLVAIVVLGVLDQTSPATVPPYAQMAARWHSDDAFVGELQQKLPRGAKILQLPYIAFPEAPQGYAPVRGYVHSDDLRWSFPAMRGRLTDWQQAFVHTSMDRLVPSAAAAGFAGIWVDRSLYGSRSARIEGDLTRILGEQPMVSPAGDVAFFDLRPYAERLRAMHSRAAIAAAGTALVRPFVVRFGPGFDTVEGPPYASVHWADTSASFRMINPAGRARPAVFSAVVVAKGAVTFHWPGDRVQVVNATPTGTMMRHTLVLPPGSNIATMTTNAPAADGQAADRRVQLSKVRLSDPSFGFGRR